MSSVDSPGTGVPGEGSPTLSSAPEARPVITRLCDVLVTRSADGRVYFMHVQDMADPDPEMWDDSHTWALTEYDLILLRRSIERALGQPDA